MTTNWMNKTWKLAGGMALTLATATAGEIGTAYKATVPLNFSIGSKPMPAGQYEITNPMTDVLIFRHLATKNSGAVLAATPLGTNDGGSTRLVFREYNGTWRVAEFWGRRGMGRPRSAAERKYDAERAGDGGVALVPLNRLK